MCMQSIEGFYGFVLFFLKKKHALNDNISHHCSDDTADHFLSIFVTYLPSHQRIPDKPFLDAWHTYLLFLGVFALAKFNSHVFLWSLVAVSSSCCYTFNMSCSLAALVTSICSNSLQNTSNCRKTFLFMSLLINTFLHDHCVLIWMRVINRLLIHPPVVCGSASQSILLCCIPGRVESCRWFGAVVWIFFCCSI